MDSNSLIAPPQYNRLNFFNFSAILNWSASAILVNRLDYRDDFKFVKIGKLIQRVKDTIKIQDDKEYQRVTIRVQGRGVTERDREIGKNIGTKNQFRVSAGQFIMSKIDARNGAFGIVPKELEGAAVTQDFLTYSFNKTLLVPEFFVLLTTTKQFYDLCQRASSGTTNRQRIDEQLFLNFEIPVPSLEEQLKLVEAYNMKVLEAQRQEYEIEELTQKIDFILYDQLGLIKNKPRQITSKINFVNYKEILFWGVDKILEKEKNISSKFETINLLTKTELVIEAFRGKSPHYDSSSTRTILNQKCNRWNEIQLEFAKKVDENWYKSIDFKFFTRENDILINSTGEGTIGRASLVTKEFENLIYDSHLLLLRLDSNKIIPEFLVYLINCDYGQNQIESLKSAQSTKQTELGIQNLMQINFPFPPFNIQLNCLTEINKLKASINKLIKNSELNRKKALETFETALFNKKL